MDFVRALALITFFAASAIGGDIDFTPEEKKALELFRPLVSSMLHQDFMKSDLYLMRYLRAGNLNLEKAKERLQAALEWRKAENIDNILSEDFTQIEKCMPVHWIGHDREGRPIIFFDLGSIDIRRCVLAGHADKLDRYLIAREVEIGERLVFNATDPAGRKVGKYYILVDVKGYNLRQHACIQCLRFMTSIVSLVDKHYPGLVYKLTIINAPKIFDLVLNLIRPLVGGEYKDVIQAYGYDRNEWGPILAREIDLDQLPVTIGGKQRLGQNIPKYCNIIHCK